MGNSNGKAVIWDMDGTLVDTAELHYQAWIRLCQERGLPFTRADFNATFGWRNPEIIRHLFGNQRYSDAEVAELGQRKEVLYRAEASKGVELLPGARALLEGLHAAGFKQAIGSSAPLDNLDLILRRTNTERLFEAISSAEDTQRGKPDPQVFQVAAAKLGMEPGNCVVMEDAVVGVQAARAGGMKCIAVTFVGHHPESKLRQAGANVVVKSLKEVSVSAVSQLLAADGEVGK
jgi:beta-phosphoglucomutase